MLRIKNWGNGDLLADHPSFHTQQFNMPIQMIATLWTNVERHRRGGAHLRFSDVSRM
jgi:hypothetical protein